MSFKFLVRRRLFASVFFVLCSAALLTLSYINHSLSFAKRSEPKSEVAKPSLHRSWRVNGPSDDWIPFPNPHCSGLHELSAPCIRDRQISKLQANYTNLVLAEEIIYRPFRIGIPGFVNEESKNHWLEGGYKLERMRISGDLRWATYPTWYGQNFVFENGRYAEYPKPDEWTDQACMGGAESVLPFFNTTAPSPYEPPPEFDTIVIATVPDSWSWQHFLDRATIVYNQAMLSIPHEDREKVVVVSGHQSLSKFVNEIYSRIGAAHVHDRERVTARRLVFSCRAPLIHPFSTQRLHDVLGVRTHPEQGSIPIEDRKVILMIPRKDDADQLNEGRRVLNQEAFDNATRALLERRGLGEEYVIFNRESYPDLQSLIDFMSMKVRAIIAPHGGGLYNARFAPAGTLVLEFMPSTRWEACFWEQTRMSEQNYFVYTAKAENELQDMTLEHIEQIIEMLDKNLGKEPEQPLVMWYDRAVE
ncbi:hypothetical protein BJ742DRAFT_762804 [Cladochytrium replicatum]|nr:hypothetical protein BJ742DRAFT_762804 [Cladochytrium replicatum]